MAKIYKYFLILFCTSSINSYSSTNHYPRVKRFDRIIHPMNSKDVAISSQVEKWITDNPHLLDLPIDNDQSPMHYLLNIRDINLFRLALKYNPKCNCITGTNKTSCMHNQESVLQALCRKGLDRAPDLPFLISHVAKLNPSLINHARGDNKTAAIIVLSNPHIDDDTSFHILRILYAHDKNILTAARAHIKRKPICRVLAKPKTLKFIQTGQYKFTNNPYR